MRILKNPLVIATLVIVIVVAYYREARRKPISQVLFAAALEAYQQQDFRRSMDFLDQAGQIDSFNSAIPALYGWNLLKMRDYTAARTKFAHALLLNPQLDDPRLGLALTWLELGEDARALRSFQSLAPPTRNTLDVRVAMARANRTLGNNQLALQLAAGVLRQDPGNKLATNELTILTGTGNLKAIESTPPAAPRPASMVLAARLEDGFFQVPNGNAWKKMYVVGVNIGPATPGHFASEPPVESSLYLDWLRQIGAMRANTIRVYTLLPPGFYRALYTYNQENPQAPLHLLQEIWLKDPPEGNLYDQAFAEDFQREARDVVDAIHGQKDLAIVRGHTGGLYTVDVSAYILGWLVGREIESHVALTTNLRNPGVSSFEGTYLKIAKGNPTEVWLARMCDAVVEYEANRYNAQRPVAFVNWPPLDPLTHPTENRLVDELRIRRELGEKLAPLGLGVQDDLDAVSVDEEKISPQPGLKAGYFALYHVYPFWPDFVFLDPHYREARDEQGLNNYWGYLLDLKKHYRKTPLLVGEYGLSTSQGIAHFVPNGMNHGGLSEAQQGAGLARLTNNIQAGGCAGGLVFEWIDEWWKSNWIAEDFEKPYDRKALWHNDMNPEQSFGILRFVERNPAPFVKVAEAPVSSLAGGAGATLPRPPLIRAIETSFDPSALYVDLVLNTAPGTVPDWATSGYILTLNTCDAPCGSGRLPFVSDMRVESGANFLVHWTGLEAPLLLVAHNYNPFQDVPVEGIAGLREIFVGRDLHVGFNPDEPFEEMIVETNRRRYGTDGAYFPPERYSRSLLRYGDFDPAAPDYDSLGQVYFDADRGRIRLRLSWGLLLALDPSGGLVFDGTDSQGKTVGKESRHIGLAAVTYMKRGESALGAPIQVLARRGGGRVINEAWKIPWPTWSSVDAWTIPKQSYVVLRNAFGKMTGHPAEE
jgi:tetratricopeptide (TPR) repeat protein